MARPISTRATEIEASSKSALYLCSTRSLRLLVAFGAVCLSANGILLAVAYEDAGWLALGIQFFFGPLANVTLAALASAGTLLLKRKSNAGEWRWILKAVWLDCAAVIVLDFLIFLGLPRHGGC